MRAPKKVALVHDWLTGQRGGEKVLEALAELFPGAPIYTLFHVRGSQVPDIEDRRIHTSFLQKMPLARTKYRSYLPLFPRPGWVRGPGGFFRPSSTSSASGTNPRRPGPMSSWPTRRTSRGASPSITAGGGRLRRPPGSPLFSLPVRSI